LFVAKKMPDPRETGYADALEHWIAHFVKRVGAESATLLQVGTPFDY
jgi:hypothetical protein